MDEAEFGRYRLLSLIGEGGMGKVYKAHDTMMDRDIAIKVLPPELAAEPGYEQRFRREARTAARLTEPHIIPIFESGEINGRLYLVMPVIQGIDLHALLQRDGPMSPQRAVYVIEQLAAALDAAHAAGLVHRDVKPSNALLTANDFVYLIDFGIAHDASATKLTSTGMIVGTLAYMAPERFTAGVADARSDVYALACVLYECLTASQPFPGKSMEQQIAGHLTLEPPKPSAHRPELPAGLDEVIATGMAKTPDERYQSAHELAAAARRALIGAPHTAPTEVDVTQLATGPTRVDDQAPPPPPLAKPLQATQRYGRRREPALLRTATIVLLLILLILAAGFAGLELHRRQPVSTAAPTWQPYIDYAKEFAVTLTSLDYRSPDAGIQAILDGSIGGFHDDFAKKGADFKQVVVNSKVVEHGTVNGAALDSISGTTAQVLVASTSKVTNAAGAEQDPRKFRLIMQVEKIGDGYKVSKVEFVP